MPPVETAEDRLIFSHPDEFGGVAVFTPPPHLVAQGIQPLTDVACLFDEVHDEIDPDTGVKVTATAPELHGVRAEDCPGVDGEGWTVSVTVDGVPHGPFRVYDRQSEGPDGLLVRFPLTKPA